MARLINPAKLIHIPCELWVWWWMSGGGGGGGVFFCLKARFRFPTHISEKSSFTYHSSYICNDHHISFLSHVTAAATLVDLFITTKTNILFVARRVYTTLLQEFSKKHQVLNFTQPHNFTKRGLK